MFCDHGANVYIKSENGQNPMIYAATQGLDKICMYLSMRVNNIDMIDDRTGYNVFRIYLIRNDLKRMKQLLMRGADVNFVNEKTGFTPLHKAIEDQMDIKIIKFLMSHGANIHAEDNSGKDCCEKIMANGKYQPIHHVFDQYCKTNNTQLRIKPLDLIKQNKKRQKELREMKEAQ